MIDVKDTEFSYEDTDDSDESKDVETDCAADLDIILEEIPEDIDPVQEESLFPYDELEEIPEDTVGTSTPEFTEDEILENMMRTPVKNGEWTDERGQSIWKPEDQGIKKTLEKYGADGIEYLDGIPDFDRFSAFDYDLSAEEFTDRNAHQFQSCNEALSDYYYDLAESYSCSEFDNSIDNNEYRQALLNAFKCDESELEDVQISLEQCETPYGFTWHHTEVPGRMQLIPSDIHDSARHRGGQSIWGGGKPKQMMKRGVLIYELY